MAADSKKDDLSRADRIFLRISVIQTVLAVTGFFIGVIALYAALNEADAVRKQLQASVWPHIRVTDYNVGIPGKEQFDILVNNKGTGPARVKNVEVTVDGEQKHTWFDVVSLVSGDEPVGISNFNLLGAVMSPGEQIVAVSLDSEYAGVDATLAFRDLVRTGRANMVICYCSVFDECWQLSARESVTTEVRECDEPHPDTNI